MALLMQRLELRWQGKDYDVLKRNCCHFCQEMCALLGVHDMPLWVTNLAGAGAAVFDAGAEIQKQRRSLGELFATRLTSICCENARQAHTVDLIPGVLVDIPLYSEHE